MGWSFQIGRLFGIPIRVHITFFILPLIIWLGGSVRGAFMGGLTGVIFICALFGCVVLHELGHSIVARNYGIVVKDITLLPIGGVSNMERIPEEPRQELAISIAGPAVSAGVFVVIAVLLGIGGLNPFSAPPMRDVTGHPMGFVGFLRQLMWINLILAIFNLVPAFPMDGGRILRAFLAEHMDYVRATQTASVVGQAFAFLMGFVGLFLNPWLILVAIFVFMGAGQEEQQVRVRSVLRDVPAAAAMLTRFDALAPEHTLRQALELASRGFQHDFPVVRDGTVVGIITHEDLLRGLYESGLDRPVGEIMRTDLCPRSPDATLEVFYDDVAHGRCHIFPIISGGQLVGLVTPDSISRYIVTTTGHPTLDRQRLPLVE
ncbi:MAG: site-2 protease family protein [Armatimonadota bacterium]